MYMGSKLGRAIGWCLWGFDCHDCWHVSLLFTVNCIKALSQYTIIVFGFETVLQNLSCAASSQHLQGQPSLGKVKKVCTPFGKPTIPFLVCSEKFASI